MSVFKCKMYWCLFKPQTIMFIFTFSILRSVDLSTTTDSKQFQELLLERTKAFAAQTEALKSSNSDGKLQHTKHFKFDYLGTFLVVNYFILSSSNQSKKMINFNPALWRFSSMYSNLWFNILSYCLHYCTNFFN